MIAIAVRFLAGRFTATHPTDRELAEWPPHPDRVFMALVAAWGESGRDPSQAAALRWLESQGPPELAFPTDRVETRREVVTSYVPVNDADAPRLSLGKAPSPSQIAAGLALLPDKRSRQPRHFPTVTPPGELVWLRWAIASASSHTEPLAQLCRQVTYLGHSSTPVQCWLETDAESIPPPTLVPAPAALGAVRLRVPAPGRFEDLEARFAAGLRPTPSAWAAYAPPRPAVSGPLPRGTCFDPRLLVLRQTDGPRLGLASTLLLTRALRDTVLAAYTQAHGTPAPEWLCGHAPGGGRSESDHLACVPLAHVGHQHADGHLLGLALVTPRSVSEEEVGRALLPVLFEGAALGELRELNLTLGSLGVVKLEFDDRASRPQALRPETWLGEGEPPAARRWATVTPICFDRHPKGEDPWAEIEAAIRRAAERVGVGEMLESVTLSPVSLFVGAPTNRGYPPLQRKTGGNIHHTHAALTFREPITGPLLLGAGRYRGYGFCRPLLDTEVGG
jgi:CRISPR-associated protein Csb2